MLHAPGNQRTPQGAAPERRGEGESASSPEEGRKIGNPRRERHPRSCPAKEGQSPGALSQVSKRRLQRCPWVLKRQSARGQEVPGPTVWDQRTQHLGD